MQHKPPKDATEFFDAGGTADELNRAAMTAKPLTAADVADATSTSDAVAAKLRRGCDVERRPVEWLWPGRLAVGKINLLFGQPGLGKSLIVTDLSARVTRGAAWPDANGIAPAGSVIVASAEDDFADTLLPRFDAAGGDDTRLVALDGIEFPGDGGQQSERAFTLRDLPQLADAIHRTQGVKLVILDPVSAFLGDADSHKNGEVRGLLAPLKTLAEDHRVCILLVTHLPKGASASAVNGAIGSIAFIAAARSAWLIARDPDDSRRRIMAAAKNNLGPDVGALAYQIEPGPTGAPVIAWEADAVDLTADELMGGGDARPGPAPEARERAEAWLRDRLAGGESPAGKIKADADAAGIKYRTLHNAANTLDVRKEKNRFDGGWTWRLPKPAAEDAKNLASAPITLQPCNLASSGNPSKNKGTKMQGCQDARLLTSRVRAREGGNGELFHGDGERIGLPDVEADRGAT